MTPQTQALIEAANEFLNLMPCHCDNEEECPHATLGAAISSAKAAEEGVKTKWKVECYSRSAKGWFPAVHTFTDEVEARKKSEEPTDGIEMVGLVRIDTYNTVISVREKEGTDGQ